MLAAGGATASLEPTARAEASRDAVHGFSDAHRTPHGLRSPPPRDVEWCAANSGGEARVRGAVQHSPFVTAPGGVSTANLSLRLGMF